MICLLIYVAILRISSFLFAENNKHTDSWQVVGRAIHLTVCPVGVGLVSCNSGTCVQVPHDKCNLIERLCDQKSKSRSLTKFRHEIRHVRLQTLWHSYKHEMPHRERAWSASITECAAGVISPE